MNIPVIPKVKAIGASATGQIPSGAKGFFFAAVSGTVTFGGETVPVGMSISSDNILKAQIPWTTGAASSAFAYWEV